MTQPPARGTKMGNKDRCTGTVIRVAVMVWSGAMLTAHYIGVVQNMDATFIAGLFTSTLATFGVTQVRKDDDERRPPCAKRKTGSGGQ